MAGKRLLFPQNFTSYDRKALDFVVNTFGQLEDVEVTLFHAYTPLPSVEVSPGTVTDKLRGNMSFLHQQIQEKEAGIKAVKAELVGKGFAEDRILEVFRPRKKDIAGELLDLYGEKHFEYLVLSRRPGKVSRFFTASVSHKVLAALKNTTVCVVS
jgi:hypothetical protein